MNAVSGMSHSTAGQIDLLAQQAASPPSDTQLQVKEQFQQFVAGTFYGQMLKSLHKTHDKPAYFHGGRAEEIFQGQMDQHVVTELSKSHGAAFSEPLFAAFTNSFPGL